MAWSSQPNRRNAFVAPPLVSVYTAARTAAQREPQPPLGDGAHRLLPRLGLGKRSGTPQRHRATTGYEFSLFFPLMPAASLPIVCAFFRPHPAGEIPVAGSKVLVTHIRNIGILAHIDAGKTTLSERILYFSGKTHRLGDVDEGTAHLDWMPQERERGISITAAAATTAWAGYQINLIDTPGHVDFTAEVERSLRVLDGAISLFCAVGGVEPQSEKVWHQSDKYGVPRIAFINKMDRRGADFAGVVEEIRARLGAQPVPIVVPMGAGESFSGLVDLVRMKALYYAQDCSERGFQAAEIPAEYVGWARRWRANLLEKCAEQDDALLETFLTQGTLSESEIEQALRHGTIRCRLVPVFAGSALRNTGIPQLLDGVVHYLPAPHERSGAYPEAVAKGSAAATASLAALAFKVVADPHMGRLTYVRIYSGSLRRGATVFNSTRGKTERVARVLRMTANRAESLDVARAGDIVAVAGLAHTRTGDTLCTAEKPVLLEAIEFPEPVVSVSVAARSRGEQDRLCRALHQLTEEDPTLRVAFDAETSETLLSGMGELHLEIVLDRLHRDFGVAAEVGRPQVAYRETARIAAEGAYKHVKQTGGRGQYAHVVLRVEPRPRGSGFEFVSEVAGGRIPAGFVPSVEKGILLALRAGPLAGYPVVDVRAVLLDGSFHEVDSSDLAFQEAARAAFRETFRRCRPTLLEPVVVVEISTPAEHFGAVVASLAPRRGRLESAKTRGGARILRGRVPLSEMFGFANALRTMTQGRATFSQHVEGYEPVPPALAQEILLRRQAQGVPA